MEILQACVETSSAVADQIGIDASFALSEQAREIEQLRAENKALKSTLSHYDDDSSPQDVLVQTCCDQVRDAESIAAAAIEQKDAAIALALQYEGSERALRGMVQELESDKKDMVAKFSEPGRVATNKRIGKVYAQLESEGRVERTFDGIHNICTLADAEEEWVAFKARTIPTDARRGLVRKGERKGERSVQSKFKETQLVALWFQTRGAISNKVNTQQRALSLVTLGAPEHMIRVLRGMGVVGGKTGTYRDAKKLVDSFDTKRDEALMPTTTKILLYLKEHPDASWLDVSVYIGNDDYTRTRRFSARLGGGPVVVVSNFCSHTFKHFKPHALGHGNPVGCAPFSQVPPGGMFFEGIPTILNRAGPGCESFFVYLEKVVPGGIKSFLSVEQLKGRLDTTGYSGRDERDVRASFADAHLVDFTQNQFKSYMEHGRAIMIHIATPATFQLLPPRITLLFIGDYPGKQWWANMLCQAWPTAEAPHRGPAHLGSLLWTCLGADAVNDFPADLKTKRNLIILVRSANAVPGAVPAELPIEFETTYEPDETFLELLGGLASYIVPDLDPFHIGLNDIEDIGKGHRAMWETWYEQLTGNLLPSKVSLRMWQHMFEKYYSGWLEVRVGALKTLNAEARNRLAAGLSMYDIAAYIHLMEHALPQAIFGYFSLHRLEVIDNLHADPDTAWFQYLFSATVRKFCQQRPNYQLGLLEMVTDYLYWKENKVSLPFWGWLLGRGNAATALPWEGCWHVWARHADFLHDSDQGLRMIKRIYMQKRGLGEFLSEIDSAYGRPGTTRLQQTSTEAMEQARTMAISSIVDTVEAMVNCSDEDCPTIQPRISTFFVTNQYRCPTLTGSGDPDSYVNVNLHGPPAYSLHPDDHYQGQEMAPTPDNCPRKENSGCHMYNTNPNPIPIPIPIPIPNPNRRDPNPRP